MLACLQVLHLRLRVHISTEALLFSTSEQKQAAFYNLLTELVRFLLLLAAGSSRCLLSFSNKPWLGLWFCDPDGWGQFSFSWSSRSIEVDGAELKRCKETSLEARTPGGEKRPSFTKKKRKKPHKLLTSDMFAVKWLICLKWCCLTSFSSTFHKHNSWFKKTTRSAGYTRLYSATGFREQLKILNLGFSSNFLNNLFSLTLRSWIFFYFVLNLKKLEYK